MAFIDYDISKRRAPRSVGSARGIVSAEVSANADDLGKLFLVGPKRVAWEVGIGRFLHIPPAYAGAPYVTLVGTDEGDVAVLKVETREGRGEVLHTISGGKEYRVWAVNGYWLSKDRLRVQIATSQSSIRQLDLVLAPQGVSEEEGEPISLRDWPREIRPVEGRSAHEKREIVVACENGDLLVHPGPNLSLELSEVLRTAYARKTDDRYEICTGSDNNTIRFIGRDGQWSISTSDRVREVLLEGDTCLAVSEDRYLYAADTAGQLRWRYRFPHRALCIDIQERQGSDPILIVGCGDGFVYFLTRDGFIHEAYEFPDRIRDVRVLSSDSVLVACEDRQVYLAEMVEKLFRRVLGAGEITFVVEGTKDLEARLEREGVAAIQSLPAETRLFFLFYLPRWFDGGNTELVLALMDSLRSEVVGLGNLKALYGYASALVWFSMRVDLAAGCSRIEEIIRATSDNSYVQHAFIASAAHQSVHMGEAEDGAISGRALLDVVIRSVSFEDEWIVDECLRQLKEASFFEVSGSGFYDYFDLFPIGYRKMEQLLEAAREREHLEATGLVRLLSFLEIGSGHETQIEELLLDVGVAGGGQSELKELFDEFVNLNALDHGDFLLGLEAWLSRSVRSEEVREYLIDLVRRRFSAGDALASAGILLELFKETLLRQDWDITARDYLRVKFFESLVRVRASTIAGP